MHRFLGFVKSGFNWNLNNKSRRLDNVNKLSAICFNLFICKVSTTWKFSRKSKIKDWKIWLIAKLLQVYRARAYKNWQKSYVIWYNHANIYLTMLMKKQ